jgi:transcriptional regulator with XRE-family HTH domain
LCEKKISKKIHTNMANDSGIRNLFGLTQSEMAKLLGVGPSQWSMFESGKRDLPSKAQRRLAHLLSQMNAAQKPKRKAPATPPGLEAHVKALLHENEYQQALTTRKIAAAERKRTAEERLLVLDGVLQASPVESKGIAANAVAQKAAKATHSRTATHLMRLTLKLELLNLEKTFLQSKLKKPAAGPKK